ncbi:uncharacterized protein [Nicotiana sylvestris]|uniref:uncharacterized protein n=1 Tax=Nicotiana sylvestris TaxID=4096 RepID=UPI00388CEB06
MVIPEWKWECITIDFVVGLPWTLRKFDAVWVIVNRLTKLAHFIPVVTTYSSEWLAQIYIQEIVRLQGVPVSIILDRGPQFNSHFWRAVQCFIWPAMSFAWFEPGDVKLFGTDLVKDALEKVKLIQEQLQTSQSRQKSYADQKTCNLSFLVGEKVLLKVSPMKGIMRIDKKGKLSSRFIGPFEVLRLHVLDYNTVQLDESLGYEEEIVSIVDKQVCQLRSKKIAAVMVQWKGQPVEKAT